MATSEKVFLGNHYTDRQTQDGNNINDFKITQ